MTNHFGQKCPQCIRLILQTAFYAAGLPASQRLNHKQECVAVEASHQTVSIDDESEATQALSTWELPGMAVVIVTEAHNRAVSGTSAVWNNARNALTECAQLFVHFVPFHSIHDEDVHHVVCQQLTWVANVDGRFCRSPTKKRKPGEEMAWS